MAVRRLVEFFRLPSATEPVNFKKFCMNFAALHKDYLRYVVGDVNVCASDNFVPLPKATSRMPIMEFLPSSIHPKEICLRARRVQKKPSEHKTILLPSKNYDQTPTIQYIGRTIVEQELIIMLILKPRLASIMLPNLARMPCWLCDTGEGERRFYSNRKKWL